MVGEVRLNKRRYNGKYRTRLGFLEEVEVEVKVEVGVGVEEIV